MDNSKLKEKIELNFHVDDALELTILEMLNKDTFKRSREYFIKDILLKYLRENNLEEFNKIFETEKNNISNKRRKNYFLENMR